MVMDGIIMVLTCWVSSDIGIHSGTSSRSCGAISREGKTSSNWSIYDFEDSFGVWEWSFQLYGCGVDVRE